jgi:hypothetical protein
MTSRILRHHIKWYLGTVAVGDMSEAREYGQFESLASLNPCPFLTLRK